MIDKKNVFLNKDIQRRPINNSHKLFTFQINESRRDDGLIKSTCCS